VLDKQKAAQVFETVRKHSSADGVELLLAGGESALTRFANNTIHQNVSEEQYVLSVRSVLGQKTARASTNKFDEESIRRAVRASEALARVQEPDPDLLPLAEPSPDSHGPPPPSRHFAATAALGPAGRAAAVGKIVQVAKANQLTVAGIFSSGQSVQGIFNSRGLAEWHDETESEISITMLGGDSSGWQKANSPDVSGLHPVAMAETAAQKARDSASPRELPPGKYTVILEPAAVLDLLGFLFPDFGASALLEQRSFLNDRMGTQVFGENITIYDDVYHPYQSGPPFDGEGMRRRRMQLVVRGVARNLVYARHTAERMRAAGPLPGVGRIAATGHGFPLPNEMGEAPMNLVFDPGPPETLKTVGQMVAETERGVLVTRMWYIREVDPYEKILTGMTRDGTFLVENGAIRHGLRNFRFNQSLVRMLCSVAAMSAPVRASGEESFSMVVPAMKVRDFNFTDVTRF